MKKHPHYELFEVNFNVVCCKCGNKGAVKRFGQWCPDGLGDEVTNSISPAKKRHKETAFMNHYYGFGGTLPWECTNCSNTGLIDHGGLEGYSKAFETIPEGKVEDE